MRRIISKILYIIIFLTIVSDCYSCSQNVKQDNTPFQFSFEASINSNAEAVFDTLTGNIKPWWDHTFSESPDRLFIEPFPGGGFYEYFDENQNGVRHAVVTASNRGKLLRLEGPLGLAGHSILLVTTINLKNLENDTTKVTIQVNGSGEIKKDWPALIEQVWKHFILERLKPYIEGNL